MSSIEIPLTRGKFAIIDMDDLEFVMRYTWVHRDANKARNGYARAYMGNKRRELGMHNYIMPCPEGMVIDHVNGDGLDNRKINLRICTPAQNIRNRVKFKGKTASRFKGVFRNGKRWGSKIAFEGKVHWLGVFSTEEEAGRAYNSKAIELHGDFASINRIARPVRLGVAWK